MAKHRICASALAVALLGACASPPVTVPAAPEPLTYANPSEGTVEELRAAAVGVDSTISEDGVVCRREQKTGSHMRRVVCRTEAERAAMRETSQEWLRSGGVEGGPVIAR